ncbi:siderophore ABC transporter substrate-binding protein [Rhodobacter capsulatus]|uniref:siderophore ABC transporter substrate-binding protein n=1 Tax=Rhodobacter capsulatus TaxID=1061 RepID=UPI0003D336F7|nr:siderophore ABC transporter substrate-binding protein [Rhodobacter capsulatus]ETD82626.1 iron ABC transporter substrate-binding protein [Rhodobacter capsulatus YW1]
MKRFALAAALTLAALPVLADPVTIATARGPVSLPAAPASVAVFDVAAADTLTALGVTPSGLPDKLYVQYLDPKAAAPIGTLFEPDLEALSALAPDLIIVGARSAAQFDAVAQVAPAIDMSISADVVGDARARLAAYGALFGKEAKAAELATALDARIAALQAAATGKGDALIVLTNGPKISAYGRGSRFGWIHDTVGLPEAWPALKPEVHGDAISFEFIAEVDPDWLIVVDRGAATGAEGPSAAETLNNPLVAGTKAAKAGQVVMLNAADLYIAGGGYQALMDNLAELLAALKG